MYDSVMLWDFLFIYLLTYLIGIIWVHGSGGAQWLNTLIRHLIINLKNFYSIIIIILISVS